MRSYADPVHVGNGLAVEDFLRELLSVADVIEQISATGE
jgi:hypothetical protein